MIGKGGKENNLKPPKGINIYALFAGFSMFLFNVSYIITR